MDKDTAHYERNSCEDIRAHAKNGVPSTALEAQLDWLREAAVQQRVEEA
jgi:hypothetical protein